MFYYIRHFLLSEKLYAIFLWHGNTEQIQSRKIKFDGSCYSPVGLIRFFIGSDTFIQTQISVHALKHAIAEKMQVGVG